MKKITLIILIISLNAFSQKDIKKTGEYMDNARNFFFQGISKKDSIQRKEDLEESLYYIEEAIKSEKLITEKQLIVMDFKNADQKSLFKYPNPILYRAKVKFYMGDYKGCINDINSLLDYVDTLSLTDLSYMKNLYMYIDISDKNAIIIQRYKYKAQYGDKEGAIDDLNFVIDSGKADGRTFYERYLIKNESGDLEGAKNDLIAAINGEWAQNERTYNMFGNYDSWVAEARYKLGQIYFESKAYEDALVQFKKAISFLEYSQLLELDIYDCNHWKYYFFRAKTRKELGEKEKKWCKDFSRAETLLAISSNKCTDKIVEGVFVEGDRYIKELSRIVVGCK